MRKKVGLILLVAAAAVVLWTAIVIGRVGFWISPPAEKFARAWSADVRLLESSGTLPKQWKEIRNISVKTDHSPIQDWITTVKPPIHTTPKGNYRLDVFLIHWIEKYRYGVVVQYNLVDLSNNNTIWELGRTYQLGIVY